MKTLKQTFGFISNIVILFILAASLYGCEDHRIHNMVDDNVYLLKRGFIQENIYLWTTSAIELPVVKSGIGYGGAGVRLKIDETALGKYNARHGTEYELLPADCYSLKDNAMEFSIDDYMRSFLLNLNIDRIRELNKDDRKYAFPCIIEPIHTDNRVKVDTTVLIYAPVFLDAYVQFTTSTANVSITSSDEAAVNCSVSAEKIYTTENDVNITIEVDEGLAEAYNNANGTDFEILPAAVYGNLSSFTLTIPSSLQKESYILELKKNGFEKTGKYLLPLRITSVSENFINPKLSSMFIVVTYSNDMINPLERWAEYNIGEINKFAEGDPRTAAGGYFQFGRNISFPATGNLNIITGATSPKDPKTWGNAVLYLEPLATANNSKWNWYSEALPELNSWKKIVNYAGEAPDVHEGYVGTNGGDPSPVGYHIPTWKESLSLIAYRITFTTAVNSGIVTEQGIDVLGNGDSKNYQAEYMTSAENKVVGIRFKGTIFESAFEYSINNYNTGSAHICIKAKNIYNDETIDDIKAWTDEDWQGAIVRYFPVTGYRLFFSNRTSQFNSNSGKEVYFWIDNILSNPDPEIRKASQFGFTGWNPASQAWANGSAAARDMAVPCRPIKNYE